VFAGVAQWPEPVRLIVAALGGYLIGSLPIGYLTVGALTERDVRDEGSGRTGGTNAYRAGGFLGGFLTIVGDFLKGMCAVLFGALMLPMVWAPVLSGLGGVLGHNASIFLAFRGGAGTISNMGAATAFWPPALLLIAPVFVLGMFVIRIASLASIIMNSGVVVLFFVLVLVAQYPWPLLVYAVGAWLLSLYALRPNIKRLRNGTEPHVPPIRIFRSASHG
ncbi:MAG TPA: glycerol-3-phosphate acyltransferase, partial [Anaerolineae bacterium]|nr:glycerol-3-phosphate acyltransferase [Anaerolineae bacterium]